MQCTDFQHNNLVFITGKPSECDFREKTFTYITKNNVIETAIYCAIRHVIPATWLNDRDQYLYPKDSWKNDKIFQYNCLAWTLFNNNIQSAHGVNHWIPFTEAEVDAQEAFASHFMTDYIAGRIIPGKKTASQNAQHSLLPSSSQSANAPLPLVFSPEARAVFNAGREAWKYYHAQPQANPNAALYDIKEHFQGRNARGALNTTSTDETYTALMAALREALKNLAAAIESKVYEHGFLLR
ncbi:MAG: hypothetical protein PHN64_03840 [Desulfovibrionaceae bacterium]|nr:hypothetical protein [Desulfovibrionaceae bacterium]